MSADIDIDRLVARWELGDEYDPSWLAQPWENPDDTAANSVAGGWACRVANAILVERQDGSKVSYAYPTVEDAQEQWPTFAELYGEPSEES